MDKPTYTAPDIPADEKARLEELYGLNLLDAASELRFDHFTSLVAEIFNFPIVSVTFVDHDRQWFKSSCGLSSLETNRDISFCAHAINQEGVTVVPDTHQDPRFAGNPLVSVHRTFAFTPAPLCAGRTEALWAPFAPLTAWRGSLLANNAGSYVNSPT